MNHRLQVFGWKNDKDPDQHAADHISSYHHSKYRDAYLEFIRLMGKGKTVQLLLLDLDNPTDWVLVDDSRWKVDE